MSILQKAEPEMAFLKMGIYGDAGGGKTHTASKVAIGLHKYTKAKKPIAFLDTETGSDFVLPMFNDAGVELKVGKTRAFADLLDGIDEAEKDCSVLILDSITHYWNEMVEAYCEKHNIAQLSLRHWQPIKQTWREFTKRYVRSSLHIIMCGRAADKWEDVEDNEGVKELKKVGTKMRAETETAYEPSLLVEMVKFHETARAGGGWLNRAWVVKDRFDIINHLRFDNPDFEAFLPHIERLNLGGKHKAIEPGRSSVDLFDNKNLGAAYYRRHDELVEEIKAEFQVAYPLQNAEQKTARLNLMKEIFDTRAYKTIEHMKNDDLEMGLCKLRDHNEAKAKETKEETHVTA